MGFIAKYPYTDFHELNLDYLLQVIKSVETTLRDFVSLNAIKYADPIQWSITRQYEKNTVVIDPLTGTAYISVAPVPIGAALTRPEYWTVIFDLEQFVTKASENFANTYEAQTTTTATQATPQYGWIVWGGILYVATTNITPGDAYVVDGNITRITVEDICGHIETLNTTDKSNLVAAVNEVLATLISTAGDLNSLTTTDKSNLVAAINEVITTFDAAVLDIQTDMGDLATLATTDKSSLVNAINEVLGAVAQAISDLTDITGDLDNLTTTDKSNLVAAINEVLGDLTSAVATIDGVTGNLANLATVDQTSLVNAINEVLGDLTSAVSTIDGVTGDLANLTTTDKTSLVNAINEVLSDLATAVSTIDGVTGDLANLTTTDKTSLVNAINEVFDMTQAPAGYVTPEMFGAVGDGTADDTAALQNALDTDKNVFLLGLYKITSDITINHYGGGSENLRQIVRGGTVILHNASFVGNAPICGGVIFMNVMFTSDGNYTAPAFDLDKKLVRMKFVLCKFKDIDYPINMGGYDNANHSQEAQFFMCHFQNGVTAFKINNASYCMKIENTNINNYSGYGVFCDVNTNLRQFIMSGVVIENCGTGIKFNHSINGASVNNCYFEGNTIGIDLTYLETDSTGATRKGVVKECYFDVSDDTNYILLPWKILRRETAYQTGEIIPYTFENNIKFSTTPSSLFVINGGGTPSAYTLDFKFVNTDFSLDPTLFHQYELHCVSISHTIAVGLNAGDSEDLCSYADLLTAINRATRPDIRGYIVRASSSPLCVYENSNTGNIRGYFPAGIATNAVVTVDILYY